MHPVIVSGRHLLDTSIFPADEFEERIRQIRELMDTRGLDGLVIYGNGEHSAALTYLTNLAPRMRWALAFIPRHGDVELVVGGPERDLHFALVATWVRTLTPYDKMDPVVKRWADALRTAGGQDRLRLGLAGARHVRQHVLDAVGRSVGQEADGWIDVDDALDQRMACLRPRELRVMRSNVERVAAIASLARDVVSGGGKAADAARAAERAGLLDGAHEVRALFSRDGGLTLQPFERVESESSTVFAGYFARRELGYWVEVLVSHNVAPAHAKVVISALSRMAAAAKAGTTVSDLDQLRAAGAPEAKQHPFTARAVAQLGLAIHESNPDDKLQAGGVYSLRAGFVFPNQTAAIGSVVVLVHAAYAEVLLDSHPLTTLTPNTK